MKYPGYTGFQICIADFQIGSTSKHSRPLLVHVNQPRVFRAVAERGRGLARGGPAAYAGSVVKTPLVNVEEKIDRFVGRRTGTPDALSTKFNTKADAVAWRKAFGGIRVPRGVYRFKTHEEADAWLWRMICRPTN